MRQPTPAQLKCLRFLDDYPPDGCGRVEWCTEYATMRAERDGDTSDATSRLRYETAHRVFMRCVGFGWVDPVGCNLTPAGRSAIPGYHADGESAAERGAT